MCFAPQRRALFRHLNFQKWSENDALCTCWLRNVLGATTACNFSSLIWPDASAPAALASLLFDPAEPQITGKKQCFATFLPFRAPASSFFWLFLFCDLLSTTFLSCTLLFSLTLPICLSSVQIVGSLTSKLPSTTTTTTALHHTTSSSCGEVTTATIATTAKKKHNSKHLSVHQWIRSAIRESQQPISPIGFLCLKLLPPPCAVLLVYNCVYNYIYIYFYLFRCSFRCRY